MSTFLEAPAEDGERGHKRTPEPAEPRGEHKRHRRFDLDEEPKDTPVVLQQVYFVCAAACQLQHLICHDMYCRSDCLEENGLHYL